jgi:uncharacterized protein YuzE
MAITDIEPYLDLVSAVKRSPVKSFWVDYDEEADVLYINFGKPKAATDSELTEDDVIVRYNGDQIIGLTILHAGKR